jgi:hypothetical protein
VALFQHSDTEIVMTKLISLGRASRETKTALSPYVAVGKLFDGEHDLIGRQCFEQPIPGSGPPDNNICK